VNCTDFLAKLTDFFDGNIEPDLMSEVKEHLGSCHHCEVVVDTTRKTIEVCRGAEVYDFPDDLSTRLRSAIMARCEKSVCEVKVKPKS
jgi:anti-sigma factor RsiW